MYGVCLIRAGFRLLTAQSPTEGFALAVNEQPDVVIVDVRLRAGPDALTFTTKLRLDARTNQMRIIVLTGDAFATDRAKAIAAGCDVFLTKPCLPHVLTQHAQTLIEPRARKRAVAR